MTRKNHNTKSLIIENIKMFTGVLNIARITRLLLNADNTYNMISRTCTFCCTCRPTCSLLLNTFILQGDHASGVKIHFYKSIRRNPKIHSCNSENNDVVLMISYYNTNFMSCI